MSMNRRSSGHWFMGLIILIIGIILLLENVFGIKIWENVWLFWPVLIILWGLMELFQRRSIFFGVVLVAVGALFLLKNWELYPWSDSILRYWPIIIIALGIDKIFRHPESAHLAGIRKQIKGKKEVVIQDDEII